MKIEVRLAQKPDRKAFVNLALERDRGLQDVRSCYDIYRKAIGNPSYWNKKFSKLVVEKRLLLVFMDKKPVGIVTERDFTSKVVSKNLDTARNNVDKIMTSPVIVNVAFV